MLLVPHRPSVLKVFRCKIWGDRVVQVSVQFSRYTSRHMLLSSQMNRCNTLDVHALSGSPFHLMSSSFCTFTYILNRLVLMFMVIILKSAFFVGFLIISILANAYYVPPPIFSSSQLPHLTLYSFLFAFFQATIGAVFLGNIPVKLCFLYSRSRTPPRAPTDLEFFIGTQTYVLSPDDYVIEQEGQCFVGIQPMGMNMWILGDVFMRMLHTMYLVLPLITMPRAPGGMHLNARSTVKDKADR